MKINIAILTIMVLITINLNSIETHGLMHEAKSIQKDQIQHNFILNCSARFLQMDWGTFNAFQINYIYPGKVGSILNQNEIIEVPNFLLIPSLIIGWQVEMGLVFKGELSFGIQFTSPVMANYNSYHYNYAVSQYFMNFFGPGLIINIGLKKEILSLKRFILSFKVDTGLQYSGDLNGEWILKNSLYWGSNNEQVNISGNIYVQAAYQFGYITANRSNQFSGFLTPGSEITLSIQFKNGFVFLTGINVEYQLHYINIENVYDHFYYSNPENMPYKSIVNTQGRLKAGINFSFGKKITLDK